ncbi:MAG: hypothetical protein P8Y97_12670 [Candidatus Lokiarchaeota archaeon]
MRSKISYILIIGMGLIFLGGTFSLMITNVTATAQNKTITEYADKDDSLYSMVSTTYSSYVTSNDSLVFGFYTNKSYGQSSEEDFFTLIHFNFSKKPQSTRYAVLYFTACYSYVNGAINFNANAIPNIQKLLICTDSWNQTNFVANMQKMMNDSIGIFSNSTTITKNTSQFPYITYSVNVSDYLYLKNGFTLIVPPHPFNSNINNTYGTIYSSSSQTPPYPPRLVYSNTTLTPTQTTPSLPGIAGYPLLILSCSVGIVSMFLIVKKSKN